MFKLDEMEMHINPEKVQFSKRQVLYLGFYVGNGGYGLRTYIVDQRKKLPTVSLKIEKLEFFWEYSMFVGHVVLDLGCWLGLS